MRIKINTSLSCYDEFNGKIDKNYIGQCVGFTKGVLFQADNIKCGKMGDGVQFADTLINSYGYKKINEPRTGAVISRLSPNGDKAGHVLYIQHVDGDNVYIAQANITTKHPHYEEYSKVSWKDFIKKYTIKSIAIHPALLNNPTPPPVNSNPNQTRYINCPIHNDDKVITVWEDVECKKAQRTVTAPVSWICQEVINKSNREMVKIKRADGLIGYVTLKGVNGDTWGRTLETIRKYD